MALGKKIEKATYDKLPEVLQAEYEDLGDGGFGLCVEGGDDIGALKRAKDHEVTLKNEARKEAREAKDLLKKYRDEKSAEVDENSRSKGDVEALDKSWIQKYTKQQEQKDGEISTLTTAIRNMAIDTVAEKAAKDISTIPALIAPLLKARLSVEIENGKPVTRVLDASGAPSAMTIGELKTEFRANPEYSGAMIGSKATGGSKPETKHKTHSSSGTVGNNNTSGFMTMTNAEKVAYVTEKYKLEGIK